MSPSQVVAVFSNLDPGSTVLVLEELSNTAQREGFFEPMILDSQDNYPYHTAEWTDSFNHPWRKYIKRTVWGHVPFLPLDQWGAVLKNLKTKDTLATLENARFFLICNERNIQDIHAHQPTLAFFIRPDSGAASFTYNILQKMKVHFGQIPKINFMIFGHPHIEEAAMQFDKLTKEIESILGSFPPLKFCAHICPSDEKIRASSYPSRLSLVESFPEDAFHGQMKKIAKICRDSHQDKSGDESFSALVNTLSPVK